MNMEEIGEKIKHRRKFLTITQNDLAEIADISLRSVKKIESGKSNPRFNQLEKVLIALGLSVTIEERIRNA